MPKKRPPTPLEHASKLRYDLIEWHKLTQKEITERDKKGISFLMHIVSYGHWTNLPPKLKEFSLTQPAHGDDKIIHIMARNGKLNTIPTEFITEGILSLEGNKKESVYHLLAQENYAHHIDKSLWTKKALTLASYDDCTPLHTLVQYQPELLAEDITLDDLLLPNKDGETPLYMWARGSHWSELPDKFLTKETLELKVGYGNFETIVHHICERFKNDTVLKSPEFMMHLKIKMKKILSKIDDKILNSLRKDGNPDLFIVYFNK
jgi:hypothetical protein